jgi:ferric-dicitrate binding protein FerR (iron transport regulator)
MNPHWGEQDFTRWMFGLKEEDEHLNNCPQCQAEVARLTAVRHGITSEPAVSHEFLAAQRRAIYTRLHEPAQSWMRARILAPVGAGVALAAVCVALMFPTKPAQQPLFTESDQKFFTEIGSMEQSAEPRAIQPIHNMFEE